MSEPSVSLPTDPTSSTVYLDWLSVRSPGAEAGARQQFADVFDGIPPQAHRRPAQYLGGLQSRSRRLPPEHLPWFWDTVGHRLARALPRQAGQAYKLAREAERQVGGPADPAFQRANAVLAAGLGVLPAAELAAQQRRLAAALPPAEAHREFVRYVRAWASGGAVPPADLHTRLRASAKAAGVGPGEDAALLGEVLAGGPGRPVPDGLLDAAAALLAAHPPTDAVRSGLLEMFPPAVTALGFAPTAGGGAWLRLLRAAGAVDALAEGRLTPSGGLAGWLGRLPYTYAYNRVGGGGITRRPLPPEFFDVLPVLAGRLRAEGVPVRLHEAQYRSSGLDADLADACLAEGVPVETPPRTVSLVFWGGESRRDLRALAADPVLGPRLEGTVHADLRRGTAVTRLPGNPAIAGAVRTRITGLLDELADGGLGAAEDALGVLETLLDRPTAAALDGIEEALAAVDLTGPLLRTLRAGLPEELGWPALDEALADLGAPPAGTTATWPVLTLYTRERAIAVDHRGRRADHALALPEDAALHAVNYAGGDLLVAWTTDTRHPYSWRAYWASRPGEVFEPALATGLRTWSATACQFETADRTGRYDGARILRPGDRDGLAASRQLSDGTTVWSRSAHGDEEWDRLDPATGGRTGAADGPAFAAVPVPDGHRLHLLSLVALPPDVDADASPLGHRAGLAGFRVLRSAQKDAHGWDHRLEGTDGRTAGLRTASVCEPWAVARMPGGGAECVLTDPHRVHCRDAQDGSLLWRAGGEVPVLPPPPFWHFLAPRDPVSSRALRAAGPEAAAELLAAADGEATAAGIARLLPGVTDRRIAEGAARTVRAARAALHRREELSARVAAVRSGRLAPLAETSDVRLLAALRGLLDVPGYYRAEPASPQPATLTALAADGAHLAGRLGEAERRTSPPARARDWTPLLGRIDAVAWRLVTAVTAEEDRPALAELVRSWSEQPFAAAGSRWRLGEATGVALAVRRAAGARVPAVRADALSGLAPDPARPLDPALTHRFLQRAADPVPEGATELREVAVDRDDAGRLARLLDLLAEHGPVRFGPEAVDAFVARTGARRATALFVLDGLPEGADRTARRGLLTSKRYGAGERDAQVLQTVLHRLGGAGRLDLLAAALPDDPAELWRPGGPEAAAVRLADAWARLVGTEQPLDEEAARELEAETGLPEPWLRMLLSPAGETAEGAEGAPCRLVPAVTAYGSVVLHTVGPDGGPAGAWYAGGRHQYAARAAALVWALTARPVGDPAAARAAEKCARLRAELADGEVIVPLGTHRLPGGEEERAAVFGPGVLAVPLAPSAVGRGAEPTTVFDDGLLLVPRSGYGTVCLRPARLADPAARSRLEAYCAAHGLDDLLRRLHGIDLLLAGGGLERMAARAADTPVPAGRHEADPALSVPGLVAEAAAALAVGADAAALLLQLLTLARPTDRNVRRWNGWTPARHRAAQAELVAAGLVETGRRSRAGRTAFAPGPWTELKSPELPLETAKLATHLAGREFRKETSGPFLRLLPPRPLHEMFAAAWTVFSADRVNL
ncbi:hypothetical protein [Streptomyces sp. NRRL B-24484]|uniref:hypothetical protein n=1 Tax=Streptomyces sp. NRRL B-24484 TaxID=1463833 RepID=UPI0004BF5F58|nr:hypothetical protein [Streptomyces sp. NRRL B-24484]